MITPARDIVHFSCAWLFPGVRPIAFGQAELDAVDGLTLLLCKLPPDRILLADTGIA